jgi:DNA ligase-1
MKHTYSVLPIYDRIVPALLDEGIQKLPEVCCFTVGIPVGPMLAKPTTGVSEVLDKFQDLVFTCEYKYDGQRAQVT